MTKSLNIILFGESGVGKSSLVNLIAGKQVAKTDPNVGACTMSFTPYTFQVYGISYTIWDTRGLEEPEMGGNEHLGPIEQAFTLIRSLTASGGVDLLVFCIRGGRIFATTQSNYRLFYEVLCETKVPIALAVTHLERELRMENWWDRVGGTLGRYGMVVATHACVTGLPGHSKSQESRRAIEAMLGQHDEKYRYNMPPEEWFKRFLPRWIKFCGPSRGLKQNDLEAFLRKRCGLGIRDAHDIAGILAEGRDTSDGSRRRRRFLGF